MPSTSPYAVAELGRDEIDRVEPLWKEMVRHHQRVVGDAWPVRTEQEAWELRRLDYERMLAEPGGRMLVAVSAERPEAAPLGYAVLTLGKAGATWDLGEQVGEIESLVVTAERRGEGIGTLLIETCRAALREQGIAYWSVAVVEANAGAARLYERRGFRPYYRHLLGSVAEN